MMRDEKAWKWVGEHQLGYDIWEKKYRHNNETFDQWLDRISGGNVDVRKLIEEKKFLFGGRILANRGLNNSGVKSTLSNCYVLSVDDSIESIYKCCSNIARTYSYGGGVGIDISKLRPAGAFVNNSAKSTTGAVSFMKTFDVVTGTICQNGRRGALMISIDINHPDVEEFINIKANTDQITNANISVRVSDEFMKAVEADSDYLLTWPCNSDLSSSRYCSMWPAEYNVLTNIGDAYVKKVKARQLFQKLAENNWNYAEPGVLYWDRIDHWNMMDKNDEFQYAGVNPCAEEPLTDGSACLLGSMNLASYVYNKEFDWEEFSNDVKTATIALNEALVEGTPLHPLQIQRDSAAKWRAIGLGIFDLAGALVKLGITYGSSDAIEFAKKITGVMLVYSYMQSCDLNKDNLLALDNLFDSEFYKKQILPYLPEEYIGKYPLNSQLLTIAPTGTLSTMLNALSGGGEPAFALSYTRTTKSLHGKDVTYEVHPKLVTDYMSEHNCTFDQLPPEFISSDKLNWKQRIDMQAALQTSIDASISSTVNLDEDVTAEEVYDLYMYAWKKGLKGVTIFRRNCARAAILNDRPQKETPKELQRGEIIKAGDNCIGLKRTLMTGCGSLHLQAFFHPETGELLETYLSKGSQGGCNNFMIGLSRMMSLAARGGIKIESILDQLKSCGTCPSYAVRKATKGDVSLGSCCPTAVGNALKDMHKEVLERIQCCEPVKSERQEEIIVDTKNKCPECGAELEFSGGCNSCPSCGFSKCS